MKFSRSFVFLGVVASAAAANAQAGRRLRGPSHTNDARGLGIRGIRSSDPGPVAECHSGVTCFKEGEWCIRETDTEAEECECVYAAGALEFRTVAHWTSALDGFRDSDGSVKSGKSSSVKDTTVSGDSKSKSGKSSTGPDDRAGEDVPTGCRGGAPCSEEGELCMRKKERSTEIEECECANVGGNLRFVVMATSKPSNESDKLSASSSKSGKSSLGKDSGSDDGSESESSKLSTSLDDRDGVVAECRVGASCFEEGELCMRRRTRSSEVEECECVYADGELEFRAVARSTLDKSGESSASLSKSGKSISSKDSDSEGDGKSKSNELSTSPDDRENVPTGCRRGALCSEEGEKCMWRRATSMEVKECECVNLDGELKFVPFEAL